MRILVTGAGGPAGMNAIRFLPRRTEVYACDSDPEAEERMRKKGCSVSEFFRVPRAEDPGFVDTINRIAETRNIGMIIPTVDEELPVFSRRHETIKTKVLVSPYETILVCNDKLLLYERFRDSGFCPKHVSTDSRSAIEEAFGQERIFMKPRIGRGSRGIQAFGSAKEIPDNLINKNNVFCEYLPGTEYTVDTLCDLKGNPVLVIPRIRLETERGVSVKGRTEKNKTLVEYANYICNSLKFIGPINIQFKNDVHGNPKLVEINPRISGGFPITVASGINPLEIMMDIIDGRPVPNIEWRERESQQERI